MLQIKKGSTDRSVDLYFADSTTALPKTGLAYNSSGIDLWYRRPGAAKTSLTEATLSALTDAHSDGGFLEIANGWYRLDLPDAAFATGVPHVLIGGTVTGAVCYGLVVQLVDYDPQDTVRMGLTALPNAAAEASGGLFTRGTGAGQINQAANGMVDANVVRNAGTAITATSGIQAVNATQFAGQTITAAAGVTLPSSVASPTNITAGTITTVTTLTGHTPQTGDAYARIGAAGAGLTAVPWNASWDAEVQSEVDDALIAKGLDHLVFASVTGTDITDNSIIARLASKSATADWDTFVQTTDSLEAIADASGGGGGSMAWADLLVDIDDIPGSAGKALSEIRTATMTSIPDAIDNIDAGGGATLVDADVVVDGRTWFATDYRARNIITVQSPFEGTLALKPDINPNTTIATVDSVVIDGPEEVEATDLMVNRSFTRAHFSVPALEPGTYTVTVTVTTIDSQTIPTTGTLKVY